MRRTLRRDAARRLDGVDDLDVARAAAHVAGERVLDLAARAFGERWSNGASRAGLPGVAEPHCEPYSCRGTRLDGRELLGLCPSPRRS
jgi:hypothetical protein